VRKLLGMRGGEVFGLTWVGDEVVELPALGAFGFRDEDNLPIALAAGGAALGLRKWMFEKKTRNLRKSPSPG